MVTEGEQFKRLISCRACVFTTKKKILVAILEKTTIISLFSPVIIDELHIEKETVKCMPVKCAAVPICWICSLFSSNENDFRNCNLEKKNQHKYKIMARNDHRWNETVISLISLLWLAGGIFNAEHSLANSEWFVAGSKANCLDLFMAKICVGLGDANFNDIRKLMVFFGGANDVDVIV